MLVGIEIEGFELLVHLAVPAVDEIAVPQMEELAGNHADAALHQVTRLYAPPDEMRGVVGLAPITRLRQGLSFIPPANPWAMR